ncbi:hypothetical protein G4B88_019441 [Cannabis sativa]|uniref:Anaphase-promoting complex subunit 5 n=1 Tax=Cannabis sativa TaxID=3483 RepID=A0A7J6HY66_CANSA|nr:hypothetical protein G4B88_019441 [Cannabis sativa]
MTGILKLPGAISLTPHKVSVCILLQIYAPPAQISVPFPFSSVSQHNRLGLFLLAITKSCDDIFEPKLEELINQLREIGGLLNHWLTDHLTSRLSSLSSPDDLFNFFSDMRGILGGPEAGVVEDDQVILDPNSNLGMFLRRCLLAFNLLSYEGLCHLLTNIGIYCKEALSSCPSYDPPHLDDSSNELEYENMDLENLVYGKVDEEIEARERASEGVSFHLHMPKALFDLAEDIEVPADPRSRHSDKDREVGQYMHPPTNTLRDTDSSAALHGGSFSLNAFELVLRQLQKSAPKLHRVRFLRYLNSLYHDDYFAALENLHCYFDYSLAYLMLNGAVGITSKQNRDIVGIEGLDYVPPVSGCYNLGRYEVALLCLGMMHFHYGHPKQALEVLTEAVHISQQQSNDVCLAYTLAAICNLLSETGISSTTGILGSSYSPLTSIGISLSVQQQLFVLLRGSLKRAENLKLKRLVASNHLAMARFDLTHVQRPLLSFGPKASLKLRTSPINVCKELRSSSQLITEFASENTTLTTDGHFSTAWLKNLQKPMGSQVLSQENGSESSNNAFQFCGQPSSIPGSVLQLMGSTYLLRATAWETYGSASLAKVNALVYATCFADVSSTSDASLAYVKLIQHLAVFKGYKEAFAALKMADEKFLTVSKSRILVLKLQLLHEHALHRGHLKLAQQVCDELGVLASSVTGVDMELKTEAGLRRARTLLAANQFSELGDKRLLEASISGWWVSGFGIQAPLLSLKAAEVAHSLFCMCYKFNLQVENATTLLLLAEIHKRSGNPVLGLPYALASLSFCQSFNLDLLRASAVLTLAELWLSLGSNHAKRALSLIHGVLPTILGHGGLELRARAYIYHELAAEAFYLKAIVYDKLGKLEDREEAATSFKKHTLALENPHDDEDSLINML